MDYFGSRISCNGKSYSKEDIQSIDKIQTIPGHTQKYDTYVYKVQTTSHLEGILKIHSDAPNFKASDAFIKRCQGK